MVVKKIIASIQNKNYSKLDFYSVTFNYVANQSSVLSSVIIKTYHYFVY